MPPVSFTEIAVEMASRIARQHGCELESFSLDGVETYTDEHGDEIVKIEASARIVPKMDEIPFTVAISS